MFARRDPVGIDLSGDTLYLCEMRLKTVSCVVLSLSLVQSFAQSPAGQTTSWEQTAFGTELHANGRYAEAERAFRRALEKAEEAADPRRIARSLNDLAVVLRIRGDVAHAEEMYAVRWPFGKHCRSRRTWLRV